MQKLLMHVKEPKVLSAEFLRVPLAAAETPKTQRSLIADYFSIFKIECQYF